MNIITVEGGNKKRRLLAEEVVSFCIQKLMPRMRTLDIEVVLTNISDADGYCNSDNNREFELEIDKKLKDNDFISTVAHEMVHVWQYATRQLTQRGCKELWRGKDYTDASYSKKPWERQAVRMEKQLLQDFKKTRKKNEKN
tara:strand:- start:175 stop:597 length:423 start_codon:yes stop_codon:yes gene_type:complete